MAQNTDAIVIAQPGQIYRAPTGSTLPADSSAALDVAFNTLGHIGEDGTSLSVDISSETVKGWSSRSSLRSFETERETTFEFVLLEWSKEALEFAFGATVTEPDTTGNPGEYQLDWPEAGNIEHALVVEYEDGARNFRFVLPRAKVESIDSISLSGQDAAGIGLTVRALFDDTLGTAVRYLALDPALA